jgi:hypothetical protein
MDPILIPKMREIEVIVGALILSLGFVWVIHKMVMSGLEVGGTSNRSGMTKTIFSMEIAVLATIISGIVLTEVVAVARGVSEGVQGAARWDFWALIPDALVLLGSLLASLLIVAAIRKLL